MRARGWAVGLAVMAGALVMGAGPAAAVDPVPPILGDARFDWDAARAQMAERTPAARVPGSVLRSGWTSGGAGTEMRVALARRSVEQTAAKGAVTVASTVGGTAAKFAPVLRGAGTVLTAALALDLTYNAFTGGYGGGFGFGGLIGYDSEGLWCDLTAVATSRTCSAGVATGYTANGDVVISLAGWVGGDNTFNSPAGTNNNPTAYTFTFTNVSTSARVVTVTASVTEYSVNGSGYMLDADAGGASMLCTDSSHGGVAGTSVSFGGYGYASPPFSPIVWTATCPEGLPIPWAFVFKQATQSGVNFVPANSAKDVVWLGPENPNAPVAGDPNPARWFRTDWLCEAGGVSTPHSADSANFHETDDPWPDSVTPVCDPGALTQVTVSEMGTGLATSVLYEWALPAEMRDWAATYPQCSDGSCTLELLRIDPTTANRLACFDNPELCLGWFEDPAKVDNYLCTYGGQDVALDECNLYAPTFDPARWPVSGAAPYGDPETGAIPTAAPAGLPVREDGCPPPFSWSAVWNNWWLFKAVDCGVRSSFAAVFVPSAQAVTAGRGAMDEAFAGSAVGDIRGLFTSLSGMHFSGTCGVLYSAEIEAFGGLPMELDTCGLPWSAAGPLRALVGLAFIVGTTVAIVKMVSRALGLKSLGVASLKSVASDGD